MDPKSDILLGVSNAADPARFRAAVSKLRALSSDQGEFATMLASNKPAAQPAATPSASTGPEDALTPPSGSATPGSKATLASSTTGLGDVFNKLEAFIMQTFIQSMLPKEAPAVYGKGTAGDVWKGMLAEKMGNEVAKSGQLGIAKRLASGGITGSAVPRAAPPPSVMPRTVTMASLINNPTGSAMPAPANFAKALTALQETHAPAPATPSSKTLHSWATTVEKEQG
jgi:peptidoglycan hydrolase FlgJ